MFGRYLEFVYDLSSGEILARGEYDNYRETTQIGTIFAKKYNAKTNEKEEVYCTLADTSTLSFFSEEIQKILSPGIKNRDLWFSTVFASVPQIPEKTLDIYFFLGVNSPVVEEAATTDFLLFLKGLCDPKLWFLVNRIFQIKANGEINICYSVEATETKEQRQEVYNHLAKYLYELDPCYEANFNNIISQDPEIENIFLRKKGNTYILYANKRVQVL